MAQDSTMMQPKKIKIETPIGSVESDSGNHAIDVLSVFLIIVLVYVSKKIMDKWAR